MTGLPGQGVLNGFPSVRYIPAWFPGAAFKRLAAEWGAAIERSVNVPYERCVGRIVRLCSSASHHVTTLTAVQREGKAITSAVSIALGEDPNPAPEDDFDLRWSVNSLFIGSIDSVSWGLLAGSRLTPFFKSIAGLENFILAMIKYPEVFRKAQDEIDAVVGHSRLPIFSDRPLLPYVEAILTETLRWGCPVPLSTFTFTVPGYI